MKPGYERLALIIHHRTSICFLFLLVSFASAYTCTQAEKPDWKKIEARLQHNPHEAFLVDPVTQMTPLHYAVTRRSTAPDHSYVMSLIRGVALINAEAGETQCSAKGFTPLAYACDSSSASSSSSSASSSGANDDNVDHVDDDLVWDAEIIRTLHEMNDIAMDVKSKRGHPPLSIHIMAISRRKFHEQSTRTPDGFESPGKVFNKCSPPHRPTLVFALQ
jgi:hypothetical protein